MADPSQFIALQILAKLVETRWNALPQDQRLGQFHESDLTVLTPCRHP